MKWVGSELKRCIPDDIYSKADGQYERFGFFSSECGPGSQTRPALPCHTACLQLSLFWDTGSPSKTVETYCLGSSAVSLGLGNSCSTYTSKKHNLGKGIVRKFTDCSLNFRLVKKLVSEKSDWVPSSILQPAEGDSNNIIKNSNAGNGGNVFLAFLFLHTKKRCDKKDVINSALPISMYLA